MLMAKPVAQIVTSQTGHLGVEVGTQRLHSSCLLHASQCGSWKLNIYFVPTIVFLTQPLGRHCEQFVDSGNSVNAIGLNKTSEKECYNLGIKSHSTTICISRCKTTNQKIQQINNRNMYVQSQQIWVGVWKGARKKAGTLPSDLSM